MAIRRTSALKSNPTAVEQARLHMRFVLEHARPEADIDAAADRYLDVAGMRPYYRWNPKLAARQAVLDGENFDAIREGGVMAFAHHGRYEGIAEALTDLDLGLNVAADGLGMTENAAPHHRQHYRCVARGVASLIDVDTEPQRLGETLAKGDIVVLAPDIPGRTPAHIFGRDLVGSFGSVLLPHRAGFPIVPITTEADGDGHLRIRVMPALRPEDHPDPITMHRALLAVLEQSILDLPEYYERPLKRFGIPADSPDAATFELRAPLVV